MSINNPEWYYCFLCDEEIEYGEKTDIIPDEHRQAHQACLDKEDQSTGKGKDDHIDS